MTAIKQSRNNLWEPMLSSQKIGNILYIINLKCIPVCEAHSQFITTFWHKCVSNTSVHLLVIHASWFRKPNEQICEGCHFHLPQHLIAYSHRSWLNGHNDNLPSALGWQSYKQQSSPEIKIRSRVAIVWMQNINTAHHTMYHQ